MLICKICGRFSDIDGSQYCEKCAEEQFNLELGLKFLEYKEMEESFFLKGVFGIVNIYFVEKERLIEPLKDEFRQQVQDTSISTNRKIRLETLQAYCLEDLECWGKFLTKLEVTA